jgi:serine/threonine protein kinase
VTVVTRSCPRCGSPNGASALSAGLCPACLLTTALGDADDVCPYRVLAPIAEGDAGITYLAQALRGSRGYVALKVFDRGDDVSAALARFERWKPVLDSIRHASLGPLLDAGVTADGLLYIASEFVAGWPLTSPRTAALEPRVRQTLAWQLADAVATIHARGAAHMRLEPARAKVSLASGPRVAVLGLGVPLIADNVEPRPDADFPALVSLIRELGVPVRPESHPTVEALRGALSAGL